MSEVLDLPLGYKSATAATKLANLYYNVQIKEFREVRSYASYLSRCPSLEKAVNKLEDIKG
jgi:hypothetical protein